MPGQDAPGLPLLGDAADHAGDLAQMPHAMKDPRDTLELFLKASERLRPSLGHLALHHLESLSHVRRAGGGLGLEEAASLRHFPPDAAQELGPRAHGRPRSFHRSLKVRAATGGRSRVRVHSPKKSGRLLSRPFRTNGRCAARPSVALKRNRPGDANTCRASPKRSRSPKGAIFSRSTCSRSSTSMRGMSMRTGHTSLQAPQRDEAWARSLTAWVPLSMAVRRMPMGPG